MKQWWINRNSLYVIVCTYIHMQTNISSTSVCSSCTCKQAFPICIYVRIGGLCRQVAFMCGCFMHIMYICIYIYCMDDSGN